MFVSAPRHEVAIEKLPADVRRCYAILQGLGDGATVDLWRDAVKAGGLWSDVKNWRDKWKRAKAALLTAGVIDITGESVSLHDQ